ncbi:hypothetical protein Lal_00002583 [Lupinus albus]|nr:hypothetical protein Lal_00002583 [Lupinus albus]
MKDSVIIINTARGEIIKEADLIEALQQQRILGAGLDVVENEPPAVDSPLLKLTNVVLTPHMGGSTFDINTSMVKRCVDNIVRVSCGKNLRPSDVVNRPDKELIEQFRGLPVANIADEMNRFSCVDARIKRVNKAPLLGPAFTVKARIGDNMMFHKALDLAQPGDIIVVDVQGDTVNSVTGEIMMRQALKKGWQALQEMVMPIYAAAVTPKGPYKDGPGEINVPVSCGGVVVNPGDILVGDADGIVVIRPQDAPVVAEKAKGKLRKEQATMKAIEEGTLDRKFGLSADHSAGCRQKEEPDPGHKDAGESEQRFFQSFVAAGTCADYANRIHYGMGVKQGNGGGKDDLLAGGDEKNGCQDKCRAAKCRIIIEVRGMKAKDIMVTEVLTVKQHATIKEIARVLIDNKISGVPVVDEAGHLMGMVTEGDLLHKNQSSPA